MTDRDDPKDTHRHLSHLIAVHPGRQITVLGTPELAAGRPRFTGGTRRRQHRMGHRVENQPMGPAA